MGDKVPQELKQGYEYKQNNYADINDILMVLVLPVIDGETANAACADCACHGCKTDQADGGDSSGANQVRNGFMQIYTEYDAERAAAHASCGFNLAGVYRGQCGFDLPRIERYTAEYQRHEGAFDTNGSPCDHAGKGDQEDQQDDKGDGTEKVYDDVQKTVQDCIQETT